MGSATPSVEAWAGMNKAAPYPADFDGPSGWGRSAANDHCGYAQGNRHSFQPNDGVAFQSHGGRDGRPCSSLTGGAFRISIAVGTAGKVCAAATAVFP